MSADMFKTTENPYSDSPFRNNLSNEYGESIHDQEFEQFVGDLYDETQAGFLSSAYSIENNLAFSPGYADAIVEGFVNQHYAQLAPELERTIDNFALYLDQNLHAGHTEQSIMGLIDSYEQPYGEGVIGWVKKKGKKLLNKAKKLAKKAIKTVGGVVGKLNPFSLVFGKLRSIIRPFLKKIITRALKRVPKKYRPLVKKIMNKLGISGYAADSLMFDSGFVSDLTDSNVEVSNLIAEFNQEVEGVTEQGTSDIGNPFLQGYQGTDSDVGQITQKYADSIRQYGPYNLQPPTEEFIPAVLTALRFGIKIIGRKRVINFLSKQLAKLISKWIGKELAPGVAKAVVTTGFKLLNLEAPPSNEQQIAALAANIVADAAVQLEGISDEALNDDNTMQSLVNEALSNSLAKYVVSA